MKLGHLLTNILARVVGRLGSIGANIVATAIMARALDPTEFGNVMFLLTLIAIFVQVADFGTTSVIARLVVEHRRNPSALWSSFMSIRAALAAVAMLLAASYPLIISAKVTGTWLAIAVVSIPWVAARFFDAVFQVFDRTWAIAWTYMLYGGVLIAMNSAASKWNAGGGAFLAANLAASVVYCVAAAFFLRGLVGWRTPSESALRRDIWTMAVPLGIGALLTTINSRASVVIVEHYRGAVEVGLFASALRVQDLAIAGAMIALGPLLPSFIDAIGEPSRLRRMYHNVVRLLMIATLPVVVTASIWSEPLVRLLYGVKYLAAAPAISFIAIMGGLALFNLLNSYLLLALQAVRSAAWLTGGAALLSIGLNLWLVPLHGFMAAAAVAIVTEAIMLSVTFTILWRTLGAIFEASTWWAMALATIALAVPVYAQAYLGAGWSLMLGGTAYALVVARTGMLRLDRSAWADLKPVN